MSHAWISHAIRRENLVASGMRLINLIQDYADGDIPCPYQRWISLVTGRQLTKHRKSEGAIHEVQLILDLPANILIE